MIAQQIINKCHEKLLTAKADLLNRLQTHFRDFNERETGGDEADQTMSLLAENHLFVTQRRLRVQLLEIEAALGRIEKGIFGFCEETEEPIEADRLLAIPWTRYSLEGAEIRESSHVEQQGAV